jgi:hypothetical protein
MDTIQSRVIAMILLLSVWPFLIPVCVAFYMFWLCWKRGGDPGRDSTIVQYEPPEKFSPAECGALLDNAMSPVGISATIVDLSVQGYLTIEKNGGDLPGHKHQQDYVFALIKPQADWNNLKPHERAVLGAIFIPTNPLRMLNEAMSKMQKAAGNSALASAFAGVQAMTANNPALKALEHAGGDAPRRTVALSESQNHFYLHKTAISDSVFDGMVAGGYYARRPDRVRLFYVAQGIVIGVLLTAVGSIMPANGTPWFTWILSGALTGLIVSGFGWFMPARTLSGVRALAKVRGFQDFLAKVEKDRIERLAQTPELFEKYLPFAMALGVENRWAQAFSGIAVPAPQWYGKHGGFFPVDIACELSAMSNQTGQSMKASDDIGDGPD